MRNIFFLFLVFACPPSNYVQRQSYFQFEFKDIVWKNVIIFLYLHGAALYGVYLLLTREAKFMTFALGRMNQNLWEDATDFVEFQQTLYLYRRLHVWHDWCVRHNGRRASTVGAQIVQGHVATENHSRRCESHRLPELHPRVGARPSCASQVHRHECRSAQFEAWLLLLAHGMAGAAQASGCENEGRKHIDGRFGGGCNRYVSEEVRNAAEHARVRTANFNRCMISFYRYYAVLMPSFAFIIPTLLPYLLFDEKFSYSLYIAGALRYMLTLHFTWLVNSAAHIWGMRPYDKWVFCQDLDGGVCLIDFVRFRNIRPSNNVAVAFLAMGEGWHNYHHVFPWDYKTSELGEYSLNLTTAVIDFFAKIGGHFWNDLLRRVALIDRLRSFQAGPTIWKRCRKTSFESALPELATDPRSTASALAAQTRRRVRQWTKITMSKSMTRPKWVRSSTMCSVKRTWSGAGTTSTWMSRTSMVHWSSTKIETLDPNYSYFPLFFLLITQNTFTFLPVSFKL